MPPLIPEGIVTCDNCVTQTTKNNIVRHKRRCWVWTLYCTQCPHSSTSSQDDLNYHIVKKYSAPKPAVTSKCKLYYQEFPGFYALREHIGTQCGFLIKTINVDPDDITNRVDDANLKEELCACHHFWVDSETDRARHIVFNSALKNLNETTVKVKLGLF